jgi:hypothetical protein
MRKGIPICQQTECAKNCFHIQNIGRSFIIMNLAEEKNVLTHT